MTAKYFSVRQKIGEKCISVNAPIIPIPTGQKKMCFVCSQGRAVRIPIVLSWEQLCALLAHPGLGRVLAVAEVHLPPPRPQEARPPVPGCLRSWGCCSPTGAF